MNRAIPVAAPDLSEREEQYVIEALRSSWISSTGPFVGRFERVFAEYCGTRAAIAVSSGTAALHVSLLALGVQPGDEVIVPSLSYIATANAVLYAGARPVFVDVDPATWCLDPDHVRDAITERTTAIIAVHLYGHPADMDRIMALASESNLWVIEDAAEAHGARYRGRRTGSLAHVGAFSFYGNKLVTSGEGGAVTTDDSRIEERIRLLRGQGMDPDRRYVFPIVGYNYRLTNVACALLCAQLERIDEFATRRVRIFERYRRGLEGTPGIGFQPVAAWAEPAPWLFAVTIDAGEFGRTRDDLISILTGLGIETRPFFPPIHRQPAYAPASSEPTTLPVTEALASTGINLPTYSGMSDGDVDAVIEAIRDASPGPEV